MTVLSVVQNVALAVGLEMPDAVFSSTDRTMQEMARVVNKTALKLRNVEFDWQALQKIATFTGDGVAEAFDMPTDYGRMTIAGNIWSSKWSWGMNKVPSIDNWLEMLSVPYVSVTGDWIIYANQLHIRPIMASGEISRFSYIKNTIVRSSNGSLKKSFDSDTDTFELDENLLELAVIWRWLSGKGLPADDAKNEYDRALYDATNTDKGAKAVISGNYRHYRGVKNAYPFKVGS